MKKSKNIELLFMTSLLIACNDKPKEKEWGSSKKEVYMRSDSTAGYSRTHSFLPGLLMYYAFSPYGYMGPMGYQRGYQSRQIHPESNYGRNSYKGTSVRGGFGRTGFRASS